MPFIRSFAINPNSRLPFPFDIPALRLATRINLVIKSFLDLEWKGEMKKGFFFRAEDFSDFIRHMVTAKPT